MSENTAHAEDPRAAWLREARLGMFVHWGLYSLLGRSEWVMNRERIPVEEYERLADQFTADHFDAGSLADLALILGARYLIFTTKHHEGFCLFDSQLTDYTSVRRGPKRDIVREVVEACRERNLRIALYFSLNDWHHQPDAAAALEDEGAYQKFIEYVHGQIRELMTNYGHIDILWYDGWWPFDAACWQSERMNAMARELQPHILVNNRNCLPGDFATPEQHISQAPGRLWEACMTLNDSWGYHAWDTNWKSPQQVLHLILQAARQCGNIVLNVGARGDGSIPEEYYDIFGRVGDWIRANAESVFLTEIPQMDWVAHGMWTVKRNTAYLHVLRWPGRTLTVAGLQCRAISARFLVDDNPLPFTQDADRLTITGLPSSPPDELHTVIAIEMDRPPRQYQTGGMRVPRVPHCQYDPIDPTMLQTPRV